MKALQRKAILATARSWMRPAGRRQLPATVPPVPAVPVVETATQAVAKSNTEREFTSYSLIGW